MGALTVEGFNYFCSNKDAGNVLFSDGKQYEFYHRSDDDIFFGVNRCQPRTRRIWTPYTFRSEKRAAALLNALRAQSLNT